MYLIMLVVSMLLPMRVSAQTVKGKLVDESNHPLPYANVVLLSLPDSAFVSGTISGEDGLFKLEATSVNQIVKISSIGYKTVYKPTTPANMGIVQLVSDARMLGEVVVKANLPVTRIKNDALETNVQGTVLSKAGTAEDVLAHIPGLQKKADGFEVLGKGSPLIYINGRKLRDIAELDQLTSEEIKSVEVVRNPGARYDATVGAVVRIRTVKRQGDGFGVSLRSSYDQSQNSDFVEQADVNYRYHTCINGKKGKTITNSGKKYYMSGTRKAVCKGNTLTMYASFNTSKNGVLNSKNKKAYVKYGKHKFKLTSKTKYYFSGGDGPNRYCSKSSFMSTMRSMNGLGLCIKVTNGKVVEMSFRS